MDSPYHIQLCQEGLGTKFSTRVLQIITSANIRQDGIFTGLVGHPEYHFDSDKFKESKAYIQSQRKIIYASLEDDSKSKLAWEAFGQLLHAAQDYYAHSNYVRLWAERYHPDDLPAIESFNGLNPSLLTHPDLISCKVYYPFEAITYFPRMRPFARKFLPADSHANMNLDDPGRGPLFPFAMAGSRQATTLELDTLLENIPTDLHARFFGYSSK
ncbi:MAG: hypothetical protein N2D54_04340 [Chloroflexota bacterium]